MSASGIGPLLVGLLVGLVLGAAVGALLALAFGRVRSERQARAALESAVGPVSATLEDLARRVEASERTSLSQTTELRTQVMAELAVQSRLVTATAESVRRDTTRLASALGRSEVRGRWGEAHLRRIVESAGMLEHVHFTEQMHIVGDDGAVRPDLVIHLSDDKNVIVDAKVPLDAILEADNAETPEAREECLARHARQVSAHVDRLASKAYWSHVDSTPEFVVMFVPAESLLAQALEHDPALLDRAFARNVVIATPTTFLALMRTISHVWRQEAVARNAREVQALGRELHERLSTLGGHVVRLGSALQSAVKSYNQAIGSLEGRVFVTARRLKDLDVVDDDLSALTPIEQTPRPLSADELLEESPSSSADAEPIGGAGDATARTA